jgi:hypothetical protein
VEAAEYAGSDGAGQQLGDQVDADIAPGEDIHDRSTNRRPLEPIVS